VGVAPFPHPIQRPEGGSLYVQNMDHHHQTNDERSKGYILLTMEKSDFIAESSLLYLPHIVWTGVKTCRAIDGSKRLFDQVTQTAPHCEVCHWSLGFMRHIFDISGIEINPILWFNSPSGVRFEGGFRPSSGDEPSNVMSRNRHMPVDRFRTIHRWMECCLNHMKSINST